MSEQDNKDWKWYFDELISEECLCGKAKKRQHSFCYSCYRELPGDMQKALYSRIMSKAAKKKKTTRKPRDGDIELTILTLGVGHYPEIIEGLEQAAIINIRTVEHQALAYIVKGLKAEGYGNGNSDLK